MKRVFGLMFIFLTLCLSATMLWSCGKIDQATCDHDFAVWYIIKQPTCDDDGEKVSVCTKCDKQETRVISKLNHDWQIEKDTTNCVTYGEIVYVCQNDRSHTYTEPKEPLGHDWQGGEIIEPATCEKPGKCRESTCSRCGTISYAETTIPALGHKYVEKSRTQATCEGTGKIHYVCEHDEKHTKDETIQALGHDWTEGTVIKEATCETPGMMSSAKCRRCQQTKGIVEIPALGHDMKLERTDPLPNTNPNESLCGGAGIETWKCSRCPKTEKRQVEGTNHKFPSSGWFYEGKATCQQTAKKYRICSACGYKEIQIIDKLPHDFTKIEYIKKPTCETAGTMKIKCTMCGQYETGKEEVAKPTGHDWKELGVSVQPTCQKQGHASHICRTCGVTKEYTIDKCDHVYRDYTIDADGRTMSKHCIYCGTETIDQKPIPQASNGQVEYELRLRRTNGMPYLPHALSTGFDNLKYEIYQGNSKLTEIKVDKETLTTKISTSADKLKVVGLPEGFSSVEKEYTLDSNNPLVTIEVRAEVVKNFDSSDAKFAKAPKKSLFIGDVMQDFWVEDIRDSGRSNYLSEILKKKKFIFLDFFHVNCSWCTTHTKQCMYTYERDMYKYHDDMLVILVDVNSSDSKDAIEYYCRYNKIPDDFMVCKTADYVENDLSVGHSILSWFESHKGIILGTPGHVWLDSEGVIYSMTKCTSEDAFRDMINGYFEKLYIGEAEHEYLKNLNNSNKNKQMPVSFESFCLPQQNVFENKRKNIN